MFSFKRRSAKTGWLVFILLFGLSLALGGLAGLARPVQAAEQAAPAGQAAPAQHPLAQAPGYAGSESCRECHENIVNVWTGTRHSQAFSSPIFQRDWSKRRLQCELPGMPHHRLRYHHRKIC